MSCVNWTKSAKSYIQWKWENVQLTVTVHILCALCTTYCTNNLVFGEMLLKYFCKLFFLHFFVAFSFYCKKKLIGPFTLFFKPYIPHIFSTEQWTFHTRSYVLCSVYSVQCKVYSVKWGVRSVQCAKWCVLIVGCSVHCVVCCVQCVRYSVKYAVYKVKYAVCSKQCAKFSFQCEVWSVQCEHSSM